MVALGGDSKTYKSTATEKSQAMWAIPNWDLVRSLSLFLFHPLLLSLLLFPSPLPISLSSSLPSQGITGASDKDSPKELKLRPCPSLLGHAPCHSSSLPENSKEPTQTKTRTCKATSSAQINFLVTSSKMQTNGHLSFT